MGEHRNDLFKRNAWKPFQKFVDRCAGFEVLKEGSHRPASTLKNPSTAEFFFAKFYLLTIAPIQHAQHDMLHFWHEQ